MPDFANAPIIAVDPGAKCGVARIIRDDVFGPSMMGAWARPKTDIESLLRAMKAGASPGPIIAVIERSTSAPPHLRQRYAAHRSDATEIARAVRRVWPRKNVIFMLHPRSWQSGLGVVNADKDALNSYEHYAKERRTSGGLGLPESATPDECAAACIAEYTNVHLSRVGGDVKLLPAQFRRWK